MLCAMPFVMYIYYYINRIFITFCCNAFSIAYCNAYLYKYLKYHLYVEASYGISIKK